MGQRVEVYYNNNNDICVREYSLTDINGQKKEVLNFYYTGEEAIRYMNNLNLVSKITNHYVEDWYECIAYSDGSVVQIDGAKLMRACGDLNDYFSAVSDYDNSKKRMLASKVTRKNKYTGHKIMAGGLVLLLLFFISAYGVYLIKGNGGKGENTSTSVVYVDTTVPPTTLSELFPELEMTSPIITPSKPISPEFKPNPMPDEPVESEPIVDDNYIYIEYEDRSDYDKVKKTRELYGDLIEKYATMFGLDVNLVVALATQERGVHSPNMDSGGATGLMQIQNSVWVGNSITAYNFKTGKKETVKVTKDAISDCEMNIKIGCMILQDMMRANNYNVLMGLQSYNMGTYGLSKAVNAYAKSIGFSRNDVMNDPTDCGWIYYRYLVGFGDDLYLEHVLSYIGTDVNIKIYKPDGTLVECNVKNYKNVKTL